MVKTTQKGEKTQCATGTQTVVVLNLRVPIENKNKATTKQL